MKTAIREIEGQWYAFGILKEVGEDHGQVTAIGADIPKFDTTVIGYFDDNGIKYVSKPSKSKSSAQQKAKRAGVTEDLDSDQELVTKQMYVGVK